MPMHDWKTVAAGTYHYFRLQWIVALHDWLNSGGLPPGFFAMVEQWVSPTIADLVAIELRTASEAADVIPIPTLPSRAQPQTRFVFTAEDDRYARKPDRLVIRDQDGDARAVIEIVPSGGKCCSHAVRTLSDRLQSLLLNDSNLLIIDPFPPSRRDPQGVHALLWSEFSDEPFELPFDRPLTMAAYQAQPIRTAYIEPIAVGMPLPTMPLFLLDDYYVDVPLEEIYEATWTALPEHLRHTIESSTQSK